ncbi:uncharacterized protein PFL1_02963 [Pseudozyma flocculosa PF-1]|uniref:Protein kinase domain-containing protein n=2 Tax=Pseudozyma flocculosa TaxID=84751 RepID=A0A5C3F2X7_9BASI|nr:uncharacterized protein PFL1_02963 [Pseudozyma flocculosa PF-1]EPQ29744.1 hypothetical protein PFL1_02963 [Pseudozyma flocculosa PF-1]SPO38325.1 uncharacterized protein PSFLO_03802 [Pseudozyma flocculosa]
MTLQDIPPFDPRRASGSQPHHSHALDDYLDPAAVSPTKQAPPNRPRTLRNAQTMHEPRLLQQHYPPQPYSAKTAAAAGADAFEAGSTPFDGLRAPITIRPSGRPGFNAPKAATFFLGKDHERWRRYDRDRMGLGLAWARIASAVSSRSGKRGSRGALSSMSDTDDDIDYDDDALHSDDAASAFSGRSSRSRSSRHSHGGRRSRRPSEALMMSPPMTPIDGMPGNGASRARRFSSHGSEAAFLRHETVIGLHTPRRLSQSSSSGGDAHPALRPLAQIRPPPSGSPSSVAVVADKPASKRSEQHDRKREERAAKRADRAERERERELSKKKVKEQAHGTLDLGEAARPSLRRLRSNLEEAAAAAAASTPDLALLDADDSAVDDNASPFDDDLRAVDVLRTTLSDAALDGKGPMSATDLRSLVTASRADAPSPSSPLPTSPIRRTASPRAPPLKLARRRRPEHVEGTLYDKSGPHREGAVTDGLSVRLFSCEDPQRQAPFEDADLSNPEKPVTQPWGRRTSSSSRRNSSSSSVDDEGALFMRTHRRPQSADGPSNGGSSSSSSSRRSSMYQGEADGSTSAAAASAAAAAVDGEAVCADEEEGDAGYHASKAQVYLITTPDNRVSSAAKLRRWAMDGQGRFYAAMEIKSVEAKLRAADPAIGPATRQLAQELRETYLEDILDEVQKAETLNPTRTGAVAKLLKTEDDRYVRLEEDYPEEAFFVIAGCDEVELYPVLALVFVQAIRTLARFHAAGWMHGDVKLENLMFDEAGRLVVIDYENANPYRGIPGGDGTVQLVSYDWIPPEASPGPYGRRMGPSGDLWALGCNLIRAFALRDGIEDLAIREMLLGDGQRRFLGFVSGLVTPRAAAAAAAAAGEASSEAAPASAYDLDLEPIFADAAEDADVGEVEGEGDVEAGSSSASVSAHSPPLSSSVDPATTRLDREGSYDAASTASTASSSQNDASTAATSSSSSSHCSTVASSVCTTSNGAAHNEPAKTTPSATTAPATTAVPSPPTPARLVYRFARSAPELLRFVLTRCVTADVGVRGTEAEVEGLRLATWLETERGELLKQGQKAVEEAIEMSGSSWVRPRLDEARRSLGLE